MIGYALVSANDPPADEWCSLGAAMGRADIVEHYSRIDSAPDHMLHSLIMEIEMSIMGEWARVCQFGQRCSLGDDIT